MKKILLIIVLFITSFLLMSCNNKNKEEEKSIKDETTDELTVYIWASPKNDDVEFFTSSEIESIKNNYQKTYPEVKVIWKVLSKVSKEEFKIIISEAKDADVILAGGNMSSSNGTGINIKKSEDAEKALIDESWCEMGSRYVGIAEICTSKHFVHALELRKMLTNKRPEIYDEQHVLFIGNSYTFFNDMYKMFDGICKDQGMNIYVDKVTKGGAVLSDFLIETSSLNKRIVEYLRANQYNYIFLQEQSNRPITSPTIFDKSVKDMIDFIRIYNSDAKIVLFETWAKAIGHSFYTDNPTYDYTKMEKELYGAYKTVAEKYNLMLSIAGVGVYVAYYQNTGIKLYQDDLTHPSPSLSYLSALIHAATIYGINPKDVNYVPNFEIVEGGRYKTMPTEEECIKLREIAYLTIFEYDEDKINNLFS